MSSSTNLPNISQSVKELLPHTDSVTDAAWSPNGQLIASIGRDKKLLVHRLTGKTKSSEYHSPQPLAHVRFLNDDVLILCDFKSTLRAYSCEQGRILNGLTMTPERPTAMAMSRRQSTVALGYRSGVIEFADFDDLRGRTTGDTISVPGPVWQLEWSGTGDLIYASSPRDGVCVYGYGSKHLFHRYPGNGPFAIDEKKELVATYRWDTTVQVYKQGSTKRVVTLEGATAKIGRITFTEDGTYLIAKSQDGKCFVWSTHDWKLCSVYHENVVYPWFPLSSSPAHPLQFLSTGNMQKSVVIRSLIEAELPEFASSPNPLYKNAKVVLMGEQGVGKSALANQLLGKGWQLTESTHGRQITRLMRQHNGAEYRELYLWDLAGQPNYHLIHQLHLDETCVALILFDDQAERDPFARARYWNRALSTAVIHSSLDANSIAKLLVAGRIDRGDPHVSPEAIQRFVKEYGFKSYFRTSARTGAGIEQLKKAVLDSIQWDDLPSVSSTTTFQEVQELILRLQAEHIDVMTTDDAYDRLLKLAPSHKPTIEEFRTCVALLESRGLVRRLSLNDSILFGPELLDGYASAIVNQARVDPNGLGSVKEDDILKGRFLMGRDEKAPNEEIDRLLRVATLEDIILRQLAFREVTADGAIIVFPSQFTREHPDLPSPNGIEIRVRFTGPLQNIYSIMTVRLFYTKLFTVTEIWKNGVVIRDDGNRRAGFQISDFAEGQGEIALFFEAGIAASFKEQLIDFVQQHVSRMAALGSVRTKRIFRCSECGTEFTDSQIEGRKARGHVSITCNVCGTENLLSGVVETVGVSAPSRTTVNAIVDAEQATQREATSSVAAAIIQSPDIQKWLQEGTSDAHVVVVFTDIVGSTQKNNDVGDIAMDEIRESHFRALSGYATRFKGRIVKNTGDGVLAIFRHTPDALRFALTAYAKPGTSDIQIRAGMHSGRVTAKDDDVFGQTVILPRECKVSCRARASF